MGKTIDRHLVDLTWIHTINRMHMDAEAMYEQADMTPTLRDLKIRQMKEAEEKMLSAIEKVMRFYADAAATLEETRNDDELSNLLRDAGL